MDHSLLFTIRPLGVLLNCKCLLLSFPTHPRPGAFVRFRHLRPTHVSAWGALGDVPMLQPHRLPQVGQGRTYRRWLVWFLVVFLAIPCRFLLVCLADSSMCVALLRIPELNARSGGTSHRKSFKIRPGTCARFRGVLGRPTSDVLWLTFHVFSVQNRAISVVWQPFAFQTTCFLDWIGPRRARV